VECRQAPGGNLRRGRTSFAVPLDFRVFARPGSGIAQEHSQFLSWACDLLQSSPSFLPLPLSASRLLANDCSPAVARSRPSCNSFLEVLCPYSVFPRGAAESLARFTSPDLLHLRVFSTPWRFVPPHVRRPYFMPDPLMGFSLQSFSPQRTAVYRLRYRCPHDVRSTLRNWPQTRLPSARSENLAVFHRACDGQPSEHPRLQGFAPCESLPLNTGGLDRPWRIALLGFLPSRVFALVGMARLSPRLPS